MINFCFSFHIEKVEKEYIVFQSFQRFENIRKEIET